MSKQIVYFDSSLEQDGNRFTGTIHFRTEGYALELSAQGTGKGTFDYDGTSHAETFDVHWLVSEQSFFGTGTNAFGPFSLQGIQEEDGTWSLRKTYTNFRRPRQQTPKPSYWTQREFEDRFKAMQTTGTRQRTAPTMLELTMGADSKQCIIHGK